MHRGGWKSRWQIGRYNVNSSIDLEILGIYVCRRTSFTRICILYRICVTWVSHYSDWWYWLYWSYWISSFRLHITHFLYDHSFFRTQICGKTLLNSHIHKNSRVDLKKFPLFGQNLLWNATSALLLYSLWYQIGMVFLTWVKLVMREPFFPG